MATTFSDLSSVPPANDTGPFTGEADAYGGCGGNGADGAAGGRGGNASAFLTLRGLQTFSGSANAYGGEGGTGATPGGGGSVFAQTSITVTPGTGGTALSPASIAAGPSNQPGTPIATGTPAKR